MGKPTVNDSDEDVEAPKEETEAEENERKCKEEEEKQAAKEKQDRAECMHVIVAMVVIMGMAAAVVYIKLEYFPEEKVITFTPLLQQVGAGIVLSETSIISQVKSNVRYNGNGYLPCGGQVPTPLDCDFPPYYMKVHTGWWRGKGGITHSLSVSTKGSSPTEKCSLGFFQRLLFTCP